MNSSSLGTPNQETPSGIVLTSLLDDDLHHDATMPGRLTNHLPMALVAKSRLGADDVELQRFATKYAARVQPTAPVQHSYQASSWTTAVGVRGSASDLRPYFEQAISDTGVDAVLELHLPALLPGVGGAAFHGAIRLSYALMVSSPLRVAAALAYFAEVARPLAPLSRKVTPRLTALEVLASVAQSRAEWHVPTDGNIGQKMTTVAGHATFQDAAASLVITESTMEELSEAALTLFATTADFTALHGVTGLAALRHLRLWCRDTELFDLYCAQALLAAYGSIGAPPVWTDDELQEFADRHDHSASTVAAAGARSDDEHVAKLIYTALNAWTDSKNSLYLAVAAREADRDATS